jgi:ribosomal-protein-alanine N-acetyltransferase
MRTAARSIHIRWLIRRDLDRVLQIERASFAAPWNIGDFYAVLKHRTVTGIVAEDAMSGLVVGYAVFDLRPDRIELINLAVTPDYRLRWIGTQLVRRLHDRLRGRRNLIRARVSERNLGAQLFFRARGFVATGIEREPYGEPDHDAYVMDFTIPRRICR